MNNPYQYKPVTYYAITFFITFTLWFAGAYVSHQGNGDAWNIVFMLPGLLAPFIVSMGMIFHSKNKGMKKDFFNRLTNIKLIQPKMLPVLFLLMPIVIFISIGISLFFGGSVSQFHLSEGFSFAIGSIPTLIVLLLAAIFEELGWRGYAFDSLNSRYTYFKAALVFSILWSAWHFPLIFVQSSYQYDIINENIWYGVNFFVSIIPMGIIISWMCIKNNKSIIAAILFHFVINMSQEMFAMTQATKCIETAVLSVLVAAIIAYDKELFFAKKHIDLTGLHTQQIDKSNISSAQI
jgi:uncharacterized protein